MEQNQAPARPRPRPRVTRTRPMSSGKSRFLNDYALVSLSNTPTVTQKFPALKMSTKYKKSCKCKKARMVVDSGHQQKELNRIKEYLISMPNDKKEELKQLLNVKSLEVFLKNQKHVL